jgi:hypothetical protein
MVIELFLEFEENIEKTRNTIQQFPHEFSFLFFIVLVALQQFFLVLSKHYPVASLVSQIHSAKPGASLGHIESQCFSTGRVLSKMLANQSILLIG